MWDTTDALELREIPERLLVIGGGYIGMEMGTVYAALGSKVTVVEALGSIIAAADPDLVAPVFAGAQKRFEEVLINTKVTEVTEQDGRHACQAAGDRSGAAGTRVRQDPGQRGTPAQFARHRPGKHRGRGGSSTGSSRPIINAAPPSRTSSPSATSRASRCWLTRPATKDAWRRKCWPAKPPPTIPKCIPAVVFTDPELAWVGLTETEARNQNISYKIAAFPWSAAGRATSLDRNDGLTKMIVDPNSEVILGMGIVGVGAGELIAEGALAIEMGCTITDLKMTVHAHPTLSETVMESAEVYHGHSAHYMPRK